MSYQTRKKPHKPIEARHYDGRHIPGFTLVRPYQDGTVARFLFQADDSKETVTPSSEDWLVDGKILSPAEFDKLYEAVPEPEPAPVPEPDPIVEEAPVVNPDPPAAREQDHVQETVVAPPAIHPE